MGEGIHYLWWVVGGIVCTAAYILGRYHASKEEDPDDKDDKDNND